VPKALWLRAIKGMNQCAQPARLRLGANNEFLHCYLLKICG
jgi:hypothetical protein